MNRLDAKVVGIGCYIFLSFHIFTCHAADDNEDGQNIVNQGQQQNHFWHFDGSRFASWLPSFSLEVTHTPMARRGEVLSNQALVEYVVHQW